MRRAAAPAPDPGSEVRLVSQGSGAGGGKVHGQRPPDPAGLHQPPPPAREVAQWHTSTGAQPGPLVPILRDLGKQRTRL